MLALLLTPGLGPTLVNRCVAMFGSAEAVLGASAERLSGVERISRSQASKLCAAMDEVQREGRVQRELDEVAAAGARLVAMGEAGYPRLLGHIPDAPPVLWMRGELREHDALGLAVVGARKCTHYGREQADRFAFGGAQAGLCIVSGGAYGIDAAAHRAALRAGGRTIAVLGSGLGKPYPAEHVELFDEIAGQGVVMSELPMTTPPAAENFPRRNRIISGLSLGVLVVEAAVRSGALITARLCVEEHGREVMAVPGRVDSTMSAGCHKMIREGWAKLVTNIADVLDGLGEAGQVLKSEVMVDGEGAAAQAKRDGNGGGLFEQNLTGPQRKIVDVLVEPRTLDEIAAWTELPVSQVQADLTLLELRGTIQRRQGMFVKRKARGEA